MPFFMGDEQNGFTVLILALLTATFFGSGFANAQDWDSLGSSADDRLFFSINSLSSLQNNPPNPSEFYLSTSTTITLIRTFHWSYGAGDASGQSGRISIVDANDRVRADLPVRYLERRGNVENAYWVACGGDRFQGSGDIRGDLPPLENIILEAGRYRIVDSGQATWSHNSDTGGRGIVFIYGRIL